LDRLASPTRRRVTKSILALAINPRPAGCRKLAGGEEDWRIRVGDYRVIYQVADSIRIVRITRVHHRREVYK
jgi:mRNA interferase RelE/StbE